MGVDASTGPTTAPRPRRLTLAAVWLVLAGLSTALYGGIVPFLPPLVTTPMPLASMAIGIVAAIAGVGVWRVWLWGRRLGIAILLFGILRAVGYDVWRPHATGADAGVAGPASGIDPGQVAAGALYGAAFWLPTLTVLWVLVQRWPSDNKSG